MPIAWNWNKWGISFIQEVILYSPTQKFKSHSLNKSCKLVCVGFFFWEGGIFNEFGFHGKELEKLKETGRKHDHVDDPVCFLVEKNTMYKMENLI